VVDGVTVIEPQVKNGYIMLTAPQAGAVVELKLKCLYSA
jgi:hypothetical protein